MEFSYVELWMFLRMLGSSSSIELWKRMFLSNSFIFGAHVSP